MTPETFIEAHAASYCWRWTSHLGGIQNALAVGCALRNRVRDSGKTWTEVMREAGDPEHDMPPENLPDLREYLYRFSSLFRGDSPDMVNGGKYWYDKDWHNSDHHEVGFLPDDHPYTATVGQVIFYR